MPRDTIEHVAKIGEGVDPQPPAPRRHAEQDRCDPDPPSTSQNGRFSRLMATGRGARSAA
jgi:hypothetical protein